MDEFVFVDLALLFFATLRLMRLVITDDVGLYFIKSPIYKWAANAQAKRPREEVVVQGGEYDGHEIPGWQMKLAVGISCPFCVGFWIGVAMLGFLWLLGGPGNAPEWWRYGAGFFALNWLAAHLAARMGDTSDD